MELVDNFTALCKACPNCKQVNSLIVLCDKHSEMLRGEPVPWFPILAIVAYGLFFFVVGLLL